MARTARVRSAARARADRAGGMALMVASFGQPGLEPAVVLVSLNEHPERFGLGPAGGIGRGSGLRPVAHLW